MFFNCSLVSLSTFFFFLAACSAPVEARKINAPIAVVNQGSFPPGQDGFVYRDVEPEAKPISPMLVTPLAFPRSAPTRLK